jgi:TolB-like protein/Tfp pilus assembly protein PilF
LSTAERVERRLTAILAADVAGYSRLMGADEEATLAQLKAHRRALLDPKITEHRGRIVKTTGDGMLVEFGSVVDALRCAVEIQRGMVERNADVPQGKRIEFRVGINLGDIIIDGDDIFGDGVNVAARLEGIADPGNICISEDAYRHVRGKVDVPFEDAGEQSLKNIARPVRAYRVWVSEAEARVRPTLALPDKPSIAVLPFQNMSGDPEQEYFADGMVEDIITALSRFHNLFVIARNSSFIYKGRAVDVKQVGRELGVRYVLEGSVRKAANRVRITGQLVDASTAAHLWADRFDGALENIFELQDQVTGSVVGAIAPKLMQAEIERAKRKPTESLDAYDYYLRATAKVTQWTKEAVDEALPLLYRAIELDPDFALPYGQAAMCFAFRKGKGFVTEQESAETARLARLAAQLGKNDALVLSFAASSLAYVVGQLDEGVALIDRALVLNPNLARAWTFSGWARIWIGQPDVAIEHLTRAMRLNPLDDTMYSMQTATAHAHFFAGRYDEASSWAAKALRERPDFLSAWHMAAASSALAGHTEEAKRACLRLRQLDPALRVSNLSSLLGPYRRPADRTRYVEGLRKAGLPE